MSAPAEVTFGQLLFGSIGFMMLAGVMLVAFLVTYQQRLLRQQLQQRTTDALHQQQLLNAIIEAQERERERIGRDLHDGVGSTIATAKLLLNRLTPADLVTGQVDLLARIKEVLGAAVQDVRSVSHNLYPVVLSRFGLAEAIQHLVDVCNETGTLTVALELDCPQSLALAQELALYRICQELVYNALKHAQGATRVLVRLRQHGQQLTLSVEDDGCGFLSPTEGPASLGAGLRSIDVRAQMLHARLHQYSAAGQGTCIRVEVEVPAST